MVLTTGIILGASIRHRSIERSPHSNWGTSLATQCSARQSPSGGAAADVAGTQVLEHLACEVADMQMKKNINADSCHSVPSHGCFHSLYESRAVDCSFSDLEEHSERSPSTLATATWTPLEPFPPFRNSQTNVAFKQLPLCGQLSLKPLP